MHARLGESRTVHYMGRTYANGSPATSCSVSSDGKSVRATTDPVTCKTCARATEEYQGVCPNGHPCILRGSVRVCTTCLYVGAPLGTLPGGEEEFENVR